MSPLVLVNSEDEVLGHQDKWDCHQGEGELHRAFSVFIFNDKNELLLQRRSEQKLLWPQVWANSCCSHPLHIDSEVNGIDGAKTAAKRKMEQELGIEPDEIKLEQLKKICYVCKKVVNITCDLLNSCYTCHKCICDRCARLCNSVESETSNKYCNEYYCNKY